MKKYKQFALWLNANQKYFMFDCFNTKYIKWCPWTNELCNTNHINQQGDCNEKNSTTKKLKHIECPGTQLPYYVALIIITYYAFKSNLEWHILLNWRKLSFPF